MKVMKILKTVGVFGLCVALSGGALSADLTGYAFVNVTSDTAATAKKMAMDEARRQILVDTLAPYSDRAALRTAIANEKSSVLTDLIASSGISGEKSSDTTYSAKITMTVNRSAARDWLNANGVQNWVSLEDGASDNFSAVLVLSDRVSEWARVRRAAADAGVDLDTVSIGEGRILFNVPRGRRSAFTLAIRDAGFRYADRDGALYIFK